MTAPLRVGLIGAGWIGAFHGMSLARRVPGARLVMIADPAPGAAARLAGEIGGRATTDPQELIADPEVEAVVIAAPARFHADLVVAAAAAGRAVFCEKPMALTLADADRAIAAAAQAGVPLQVGFNRRFDTSFAAAHDAVTSGRVGTPQLLRSLTRDPAVPGGFDPARVAPWTIYTETLIHDFDTLRYLNPGAMATAEASFHATYGYDIRGEVFGSAGMVTAGDIRRGTMTCYGEAGLASDTWRRNIDLFHDAYIAELADFTACVRDKTTPAVTGQDARAALAIALAAIRSVQASAPVRLADLEVAGVRAAGMGH
jgi:myo-inositol 2-dehydrogenase/D-chiro-inositol 1-dehydrogenase